MTHATYTAVMDDADEKLIPQADDPTNRRKNRWIVIVCLILLFSFPFVLVAWLHPSWSEIEKYTPVATPQGTGSRLHDDEIQAEIIDSHRLINSTELGLKTGFSISSTPRVREYEFRISHAYAAPDGFQKLMILANGQSPGPLIEVNVGDTIRV